MKILYFIIAVFMCLQAFCDVSLPSIFSDNMVIQRGKEVRIWGKADPGEAISIAIGDQKNDFTAKPDGSWNVILKQLKEGKTYTMTVSGKNKIVIKNIAVGEVWICSGQSNMELPVSQSLNGEAEKSAANDPDIRMFYVDHRVSLVPLEQVERKEYRDGAGKLLGVANGWNVCTPAVAGSFSAVAYYYARELREKLKVPVGLIGSYWGGARGESWLSEEYITAVPGFEYWAAYVDAGANPAKKNLLAEWNRVIKGANTGDIPVLSDNNPGVAAGWHTSDFNSTSWGNMTIPSAWKTELPDALWLRGILYLPKEANGGIDLTLELGKIYGLASVYYNGRKIGKSERDYSPDRIQRFSIPKELVHEGDACIAVRIVPIKNIGGLPGPLDKLGIFVTATPSSKIELPRTWRYESENKANKVSIIPCVEKLAIETASGIPTSPVVMYNGMINFFRYFQVRGVLWYQGESNARQAYQYRSLLPALIASWRKTFGNDMYFFIVQLANYSAQDPNVFDSDWAELREAQLMTVRADPLAGLAVTIDIGDNAHDPDWTKGIHPKNKQDAGKRLALIAEAKAYGMNIEYSGPVYKSMEAAGNKIRLSFDHSGGGLNARGGELKGFIIAGADKKFQHAKAVIEGDSILVWSDNVSSPVAVRYAWNVNPVCSLYNSEGLPASPFRTDDWIGITYHRR